MRSTRTNTLGIARQLVRARFGRSNPLYLIHALTARCNARCGFCAWNPDFYEGSGELSTDEVKKLYEDARGAGFVALSLWGGEPLLRRDIGELTRHAAELGFITNMITNGALLARKMDEVVPYLDRVCISVDHPSSKHDAMRGIKGLYGKILAATVRLRATYPDTKVVWNYTIQRSNADPETLEEMAGTMKALGVVGVFNAMRVEPATSTDTCVDLARYNPTDHQTAAAFRKLRELKRRGFPIVNSYTHLDNMLDLPMRYRCHWPKFMLPIEANGDVVDCMHWGTRPIANVKDREFADILNSPRLRALAGKTGEACNKCVSIHRVEVSEVGDGRLEPLVSWARAMR